VTADENAAPSSVVSSIAESVGPSSLVLLVGLFELDWLEVRSSGVSFLPLIPGFD
jgi:hypothetical protein